MAPTIGRIVHYTLSSDDVAQINSDRHLSNGVRRGNSVNAGEVCAAKIVKVWGESHQSCSVQLQVYLDGNDIHWATSRQEGTEPGQWFWPPRA